MPLTAREHARTLLRNRSARTEPKEDEKHESNLAKRNSAQGSFPASLRGRGGPASFWPPFPAGPRNFSLGKRSWRAATGIYQHNPTRPFPPCALGFSFEIRLEKR